MTKSGILKYALAALLIVPAVSCNSIDDDRIPALPVSINLANHALWNTYGVSGFGISRNFILTSTKGNLPGSAIPQHQPPDSVEYCS